MDAIKGLFNLVADPRLFFILSVVALVFIVWKREAFIKDSLPQSQGFVDAFEKAKVLIHEKELEQEYEHSNPQIHKPEAIVNHLKRWRGGNFMVSSE